MKNTSGSRRITGSGKTEKDRVFAYNWCRPKRLELHHHAPLQLHHLHCEGIMERGTVLRFHCAGLPDHAGSEAHSGDRERSNGDRERSNGDRERSNGDREFHKKKSCLFFFMGF